MVESIKYTESNPRNREVGTKKVDILYAIATLLSK